MYCPKCGQITVHLNGKDVCTKCGIVFNDVLPHEQVLGQLKSKMAKTKTNPPQKEDYVSPIAIAEQSKPQEKNLPPKESVNIEKESVVEKPKTLEDIQREIRSGQEYLEDSIPESQGDSGKEDFIREREKVVSISKEPTIHEFDTPQNDQPIPENQASSNQNVTSNVVKSPVSKGTTKDAPADIVSPQQDSQASGSQMVYPSHQVNPFLIKTLITVFSILLFFVIVYILYANISSAKGIIDDIIKFLGERVFG